MQEFNSVPTGKCQLQYSTISMASRTERNDDARVKFRCFGRLTNNSNWICQLISLRSCTRYYRICSEKSAKDWFKRVLNWIKNLNFECEAVIHFGAIDNSGFVSSEFGPIYLITDRVCTHKDWRIMSFSALCSNGCRKCWNFPAQWPSVLEIVPA